MKVLQILLVAGLIISALRPDHYGAIKHEFYQVWDTINTMRGTDNENEN